MTTESDASALAVSIARSCSQFIDQNKSKEEIYSHFAKMGYPQDIIEAILPRVVSLRKERHQRQMVYGALWFGGGILITLMTLGAGGGSFILFYGAIIGGLIQLIYNAVKLSRLNSY